MVQATQATSAVAFPGREIGIYLAGDLNQIESNLKCGSDLLDRRHQSDKASMELGAEGW